jgi:hypothetical protein
MPLRAISIQVTDEAARAYEAASPQERRKLDALLTLRLTEATAGKPSLEDLMDEIGRRARTRGLTPELLEEILNGDA